MNDELPRPEVVPLAPPEGAFEAVVRRARLRRRIRLSMVAAVLAVVGLAGAGLAGRGPSRGEVTTAGAPPTTSTSTAIGYVDDETCCTDGLPPDEVQQVHAGRAVDSAGAPLGGIYVYRFDFYLAAGAEVRTDADGRFEVSCGEGPLLLWGVGPSADEGPMTPDQNWAPAVLGDPATDSPPPCVAPGVAGEDVTMVPGVTVTGLLFDGEGAPRTNMTAYFTMHVRGSLAGLSMRSTDAVGRYWLFGLQAGTLHLDNNGFYRTSFEAVPGDVVSIDWAPRDEGVTAPIIPGTPP